MKHEVQKERCGIWGAPMVCREGTRNCGDGAWDQIRLGAGRVKNENLALGNAAQSPGFGLLPLGSPLELGGGIVNLGPASEPLPAVAWVSSVKRWRAVPPPVVPCEVYLSLSPRPSFSSPLTRPSWPTGLQVSPGDPRKPVATALLPQKSCFRLAGRTPFRLENHVLL